MHTVNELRTKFIAEIDSAIDDCSHCSEMRAMKDRLMGEAKAEETEREIPTPAPARKPNSRTRRRARRTATASKNGKPVSDETRAKVRNALMSEPVPASSIAEITGLNMSTIRNALAALAESGECRIEKEERQPGQQGPAKKLYALPQGSEPTRSRFQRGEGQEGSETGAGARSEPAVL